jgi:hypothetical protein
LALNSPGIFSFIARACPSVIGSRFFSVTALVSLMHFSTLRWETVSADNDPPVSPMAVVEGCLT